MVERVLWRWRGLARQARMLGVVVLLLATMSSTVAAQPAASPEEGEALYNDLCSGCHTIGQGDLVGPDLEGVTDRRDHDWLVRWIVAPDELIADGDPIAVELLQQWNNVPMPNVGVNDAEAEAILSFMAQGATGASVQPTQEPLPAGDADQGKNLFTGASSFSGGGPACLACHSAGGVGSLGGGALGPDLTNSYEKWGEAGIAAFVTNPSTPTMQLIWSDQPLTPEETADIVAFLQQAPVSERSTDAVVQLTGIGIIGLALLLVVTHLLWRGRLRSVRRSIVPSSRL